MDPSEKAAASNAIRSKLRYTTIPEYKSSGPADVTELGRQEPGLGSMMITHDLSAFHRDREELEREKDFIGWQSSRAI